uniref:Uncharacterized protein n=1 Tax=Rhipicephalus zambeziensis TaxID=60191 RepID=A0A224YF55_9ACAR
MQTETLTKRISESNTKLQTTYIFCAHIKQNKMLKWNAEPVTTLPIHTQFLQTHIASGTEKENQKEKLQDKYSWRLLEDLLANEKSRRLQETSFHA